MPEGGYRALLDIRHCPLCHSIRTALNYAYSEYIPQVTPFLKFETTCIATGSACNVLTPGSLWPRFSVLAAAGLVFLTIVKAAGIVANELEATEHFPDGEEADDFSGSNAQSGPFSFGHTPEEPDDVVGISGGAERCHCFDGSPEGIEDGLSVTLDKRNVPIYEPKASAAVDSRGRGEATHGGPIFLFSKTSLDSSKPTLE